MSMDFYEPEVSALEKNQPNSPSPVVFYGSSSIRLWPNLEHEGIVNRGFGGSTLEACVYFFDRLILPLHPRSLVVYAGDNDLGDGRSPEQVFTCFKQLAGKIEDELPGVPFGFMSVKPSPARAPILDRIRRTNDMIQREIEAHSEAFFIPVYDSMLDPQGRPRRDLFLSDGLHLDVAGYRLWEQLLAPFGNRIFTPISNGCNKSSIFLELP